MLPSLMPQLDLDIIANPQTGSVHIPYQERGSDSPMVERVWHSRSEEAGSFISMADTYWEIVITKQGGKTMVTVRGPETRATFAMAPPDAEFIGIIFKMGSFMPKFPVGELADRRDVNLPLTGGQSFWLDSSAWEVPTYENADTFVERLVRQELLVEDPIVPVALREQPLALSRRTIQRRFVQATGLTYNKLYQIRRARMAVNLLTHGVPILDTVAMLGYADQPHLTRALKRFAGQTPGQILSQETDLPMSFLFKTSPH